MNPIAAALLGAADRGLIPRGSAVLLAVSGGADSMALLHGVLETAARTRWVPSVGHVHHGWRGREADRDMAFVADHARRRGLAFFSRRCDAREAARRLRLSPEAAARHVRYAALQEMAGEAGAERIATAHQQDDAVESHWIARERRGGASGLAGPRERREDGVVRPLLSVSRAEIEGFLAERRAPFRRDASNGDLRLARNRVRRERARARLGAADEDRMIGEVARYRERRRLLEEEYAARVAPLVHRHAQGALVDAVGLERCDPNLLRLALERIASPFAHPGRPPMTGRERERLRELVSGGADFGFEAGRRIRFERRGGMLSVRPKTPAAVYDASVRSSPRVAEGEFAL